MAHSTNRPDVKTHVHLIQLLAKDPKEVEGFLRIQTHAAEQMRHERFPRGPQRAIRDNLVTIFKRLPTGKVDIRAIALARMGGAVGFQVPKDGDEGEISYKGLNADFDRAIEARHVEGLVAEHTFLVSVTALTALSRRAVLEVVSLDEAQHFPTTTTILEDTVTIIGAVRNQIPNFQPTKKRKGLIIPGDTLNHNTSIEFLAEAIISSLKNSIQTVEAMERAVQNALKKAAAQNATKVLKAEERFKTLWLVIEKILALLARLGITPGNTLPAATVDTEKEETPEPINTTVVMLNLMNVALGTLLTELHTNPALFLSQNLQGLSEVAATAIEAQKSRTTTQT